MFFRFVIINRFCTSSVVIISHIIREYSRLIFATHRLLVIVKVAISGVSRSRKLLQVVYRIKVCKVSTTLNKKFTHPSASKLIKFRELVIICEERRPRRKEARDFQRNIFGYFPRSPSEFLKVRFSSPDKFQLNLVANLKKSKGSRESIKRPSVGLHAYFLRRIRLLHFVGSVPRHISN